MALGLALGASWGPLEMHRRATDQALKLGVDGFLLFDQLFDAEQSGVHGSTPFREFEGRRRHAQPGLGQHLAGRRRRLLERSERWEGLEQEARMALAVRELFQEFHHVLHAGTGAGDEGHKKTAGESEVRVVDAFVADFEIGEHIPVDVRAVASGFYRLCARVGLNAGKKAAERFALGLKLDAKRLPVRTQVKVVILAVHVDGDGDMIRLLKVERGGRELGEDFRPFN